VILVCWWTCSIRGRSTRWARPCFFLPCESWCTKNQADMKDRYGVKMAERGVIRIAGEHRVMTEAS